MLVTDIDLAVWLMLVHQYMPQILADGFQFPAAAEPMAALYAGWAEVPGQPDLLNGATPPAVRAFTVAQIEQNKATLVRLQARLIAHLADNRPYRCPAGTARIAGRGWVAGSRGS
jgi:hypothetical protein